MSDSSAYDRPSDVVLATARKWLGLALSAPSYERDFQQRLAEAENAEAISFDDAMTLAQTTLKMAEHGAPPMFAPWYKERAAMLLCRAYDAVALEREARAAAEAGEVQ